VTNHQTPVLTLMERADVSVEEAFSRLRRYARFHQQLLADVALAVVDGVMLADSFDSIDESEVETGTKLRTDLGPSDARLPLHP
jgi:hypothetical protein